MSPPEKAPVVLDGGDRPCTALLLELRGHLTSSRREQSST